MNLEKIMFSFLVFGLVFTFGMFAANDFISNYNLTSSIDEDFQPIYSNISDLYGIEEQMRNETQAPLEAEDTSDNIALLGLKTARKVWNVFDVAGNILNIIADKLQIPSYLVTFAILALSMGIIWGLIFLFTRVGK